MCATQEGGEQAGVLGIAVVDSCESQEVWRGGSAPSGSTRNLRDQTCLTCSSHVVLTSIAYNVLVLSRSAISDSL